MNEFNNERFVTELFEEFKHIDALSQMFCTEICAEIFILLNKRIAHINLTDELRKDIEEKAIELYHSTQNLIDKDAHYPEYRLKEELERMRSAVNKRSRECLYPDFDASLLHIVKYHIVKHFKGVYNLSSEGYLLLDLHVKYHFQDLRSIV